MMHAPAVVLAWCGFACLGFAVLHAAARLGRRAPGLGASGIHAGGALALYALCGFAIAGMLGQLWIFAGHRCDHAWWMGLFGLAAAGAVLAAGDALRLRSRAAREAARQPANEGDRPTEAGTAGPWRSIARNLLDPFLYLALAAVIFGLLWSLWQARVVPIIGWDPLSFWYLKTKILFVEGSVFVPAFLSADRIHFHTTYPILFCLGEAGISHVIGGFSEESLKFSLTLWQALTLAAAAGMAATRLGTRTAAAAVALCAILPPMASIDSLSAVSGYHDAPLGLLVLVVGALVVAGSHRPGAPFAAQSCLVVLLAALTGIKRDGNIWALLIGGLLVLEAFFTAERGGAAAGSGAAATSSGRPAVRSRFLAAARAFVLLLLLPQLFMAPWTLTRMSLPYPRTEEFLEVFQRNTWEQTALRFAPLIQGLRDELFLRVQHWGVLWWVFVVLLLWRRRGWTPAEIAFACAIPLQWAGVLASYLVTPWVNPAEHLSVSVDRLVMQGAFVAVLLVLANLARPSADAANPSESTQ